MQSVQNIEKGWGVMWHDFYLKNILKELLKGKPLVFFTKYCEQEFLVEKMKSLIRRECYSRAKECWRKVKEVFDESLSYTPFVYFDEAGLSFAMSKGDNSEELYFSYDDEQLYFQDNPIVIVPMFYQEAYDMIRFSNNVELEEHALYQSARLMEEYMLKKINL